MSVIGANGLQVESTVIGRDSSILCHLLEINRAISEYILLVVNLAHIRRLIGLNSAEWHLILRMNINWIGILLNVQDLIVILYDYRVCLVIGLVELVVKPWDHFLVIELHLLFVRLILRHTLILLVLLLLTKAGEESHGRAEDTCFGIVSSLGLI